MTVRRLLLAARALFFVLLFPGMVAGYIPYAILRSAGRLANPGLSSRTILASALLLTGIAVLLRCVWDFFAAGGTLAPIDPPKQLVVRGLYRYTRNPMYNGVLATILGGTWLFRFPPLGTYALIVLLIFHLMVVLYEEPALEAQFGDSYADYRNAVPRWGVTVRPYALGVGKASASG